MKEPVEVGLKYSSVGTVSTGHARVTGVIEPLRVIALFTTIIPRYATAVALGSYPLKVGVQPKHGWLSYLGPAWGERERGGTREENE